MGLPQSRLSSRGILLSVPWRRSGRCGVLYSASHLMALFIIWRCLLPKKFATELAIEVHAEFKAVKLKHDFATRGRKAQFMLDSAIKRDTDPYVPMDTGTLARSVQTSSPSGSGLIIYDTSYARKIYYGKYDIKKTHHPLACREWFEASKAANEKRWIAEVERILKGGNGR